MLYLLIDKELDTIIDFSDVIKKGDDHCKNCPYNRQTL